MDKSTYSSGADVDCVSGNVSNWSLLQVAHRILLERIIRIIVTADSREMCLDGKAPGSVE